MLLVVDEAGHDEPESFGGVVGVLRVVSEVLGTVVFGDVTLVGT